jgi:prepilin-type processing-associated H-X9-DG protein/prepilin-type N-terminal cleavage/methylation domain-containing protein
MKLSASNILIRANDEPLSASIRVIRGQAARQKPRPAGAAFTLIELLVVIGIIGVLAGLLLPTLGKAKEKGRQAICLSNQKQVAMAFHLYLEEQKEQFPAPGSQMLYGPLPEDWLHWQWNRAIRGSAIAPYAGDATVLKKLFRCPTDAKAADLAYTQTAMQGDYGFSYAMTALRLTNDVNAGLALALDRNTGRRFPFLLGQVKNPSAKIVFVEEDRTTLNDARWMPEHNLISRRHNGRSNVGLVDGHVETVERSFAKNPAHFLPEH